MFCKIFCLYIAITWTLGFSTTHTFISVTTTSIQCSLDNQLNIIHYNKYIYYIPGHSLSLQSSIFSSVPVHSTQVPSGATLHILDRALLPRPQVRLHSVQSPHGLNLSGGAEGPPMCYGLRQILGKFSGTQLYIYSYGCGNINDVLPHCWQHFPGSLTGGSPLAQDSIF